MSNGVPLSSTVNFQNLLGTSLEICSTSPLTGYFRNGYCASCPDDYGVHTVCAQVTQDFLDFTRAKGNDLSTANPPSFPGLKVGDKWCLCVSRWFQAYRAGKAPAICAKATNPMYLQQEQINVLLSKAIDLN